MSIFNTTRLIDELDAVNYCLRAVGVRPVLSLDGVANRLVGQAIGFLNEFNIELQSEGWSWNTIYKLNFTPNINGEIELPENLLALKASARNIDGTTFYATNFRMSARRKSEGEALLLFNVDTGSFQWERPVSLELRQMIPYHSMPPAARLNIAARAAQMLNASYLNDALVNRTQADRIASSRIVLEQVEDEFDQHNNSFTYNPHMTRILGGRRRQTNRGRT